MIDILWLLVCSGLVFLMQPGFMCLESGLTRSKNSINVAIKNFTDFGVSVALFWAFGYALMFGATHSGWVGLDSFFISIESTDKLAAFFLFEAMFCSTATTIVSGAVAERMKFIAYLIVACIVSGLIYPIFGHWAWNGINVGTHVGWLGRLGFVDFAGSSVVHSVGGWVSLATLLVIGPRAGRFAADGSICKINGSNLPLSVLGALLLWLGWLGFNGGSTLTLNEQVPSIVVHTVLAGVAGMITTLAVGWRQRKVPEVESLINGSLAGLVSITASCHAVTTPEAVIIGGVGGVVMLLLTDVLKRSGIDDAVEAVPVHLGGGIWGTLAAGLFGDPKLLHTGLSWGQQLTAQLIGVGVAFVWAFGLTYLLLRAIDRVFPLRVSAEDEQMGLNVSEHAAKTEILDLFSVMDAQAKTQDLSLRVPVEPFTEVGQIADRYNQVMNVLEEAVSRTEAIVKTATDAIITFTAPTLEILTANPSTELIFGRSPSELIGLSIHHLVDRFTDPSDRPVAPAKTTGVQSGQYELTGRRATGKAFPLEAAITEAKLGSGSFYTGTFRDISDRKQAEAKLTQANAEIRNLNKQLKAENQRMSAELEISRQLQQMLLPTDAELDQIEGLEIAGFMEPATEVGGDYYDVLAHKDGVKIGIGDVTGHGLESSVLMLMVQMAVRTLLSSQETNATQFLSVVNRAVYANVQRMNSGKNMTLALLDYQNGHLCLSGQHEEMILVRAGGVVERVDTIDLGFPLGLEAEISEFIHQIEFTLYPQDIVILYTDGITEAENSAREQYGVERLCQIVSNNWQRSAKEIRQIVIDDVWQYIDNHIIYDDITLLVIKQK